MNSFRFIERGIAAEIERQERLRGEGGQVEQETLHFDPQSGQLSSLRSKEEAHDYRYFPEPDLVPLAPTEQMLERARAALPELPAARAERLERELELPVETARLLAFQSELGDFYEAALLGASAGRGPARSDGLGDGADPRVLANWTTNELRARVGDADPAATKLEPAAFARLVGMVAAKEVSASAGKEVLDVLVSEGGDPATVVESKGLARADSGELEAVVERAIADNPDAVEKIRAGKGQAIGAIIGAVMRETKGRADGGEVQRMVREKLGA
jgi:aspartyl-tRNA(Asn)/glutamyl-tRNA(Gln) amidotransferase subunit B